MITVKYLLHHLMRQTLTAGFMCLLWPPHLWVKGRSRRHHIDGGANDVCRSYGRLEGDGDPHMAPWAWWWGSARSRLLAILHCTSLSLPSKTGRAVWGWPGWRPVPHMLAGLPGSSNGNDHEGAGKETPHLGGKLHQVGLVSAITDLWRSYTPINSRMCKKPATKKHNKGANQSPYNSRSTDTLLSSTPSTTSQR